MPLPPLAAALVGKAFFFDEYPTGKPHPPRRWGSRTDVAKRFAPAAAPSAGAPPPPGITLTLSSTDATVKDARSLAARGGLPADGRLPQDLLVTATAEGGDGWTYMLGYDAGASCGFARAAVASPASAAAVTWFQAGGHVRLDAATDVIGGGGGAGETAGGGETAWGPEGDAASGPAAWRTTAWGTLTLRDDASQSNSTACNLAEREVGFVVAPFTARTSTAAAALRLERVAGGRASSSFASAVGGASPAGPGGPGGGWAVEGAYDFQTCRSYASLEAPLRLPFLFRRRLGTLAVRWAAQDGVGMVEFTAGGPPVDGACSAGAAAAAAGVAAGARGGRASWVGRLGRLKAFLKADAGPGKAWMGTPSFGVIIDRVVEL